MDKVRLGIIGPGNMGSAHASQVTAGKIPRCELSAVCDEDETRRKNFDPKLRFTDAEAMFGSGAVGAVRRVQWTVTDWFRPHAYHASGGWRASWAGEAGQVLTCHNHAIELVRAGSQAILDYIYMQTDATHGQGEIDTYWIQYGGGDPVEWFRKLAGRLPLPHMKDYRFTTDHQPAFGEIGSGNLHWKKIIAAAEKSGCRWFIFEQDTRPGDPFDSIAESYRYVSARLVS